MDEGDFVGMCITYVSADKIWRIDAFEQAIYGAMDLKYKQIPVWPDEHLTKLLCLHASVAVVTRMVAHVSLLTLLCDMIV